MSSSIPCGQSRLQQSGSGVCSGVEEPAGSTLNFNSKMVQMMTSASPGSGASSATGEEKLQVMNFKLLNEAALRATHWNSRDWTLWGYLKTFPRFIQGLEQKKAYKKIHR